MGVGSSLGVHVECSHKHVSREAAMDCVREFRKTSRGKCQKYVARKIHVTVNNRR